MRSKSPGPTRIVALYSTTSPATGVRVMPGTPFAIIASRNRLPSARVEEPAAHQPCSSSSSSPSSAMITTRLCALVHGRARIAVTSGAKWLTSTT